MINRRTIVRQIASIPAMVYNPPMAGTATISTHLKPLQPVETSKSALNLYKRHPELRPALHPWPVELTYSRTLKDTLVQEYRRLREGEDDPEYAGFQYTGKLSGQWRDARRVPASRHRYKLVGNCAAFALAYRKRLIDIKIPPEALSLVVCERAGDGHMVLAVHTTKATFIACSIIGCATIGQSALRLHKWQCMEYGAGWHSLEAPSLEEFV